MTQVRRLLAIFALVFAGSAWAASTADRSPFTQGHWWNSNRSGSGFELFNAADQVMVIWYTYEVSGRPVWYTSQGTLASVGESWPLLRHRWADGRKAGATTVGSLRLTVRSAESINVRFDIGGTDGNLLIQPFLLSGTVNEVDRTGSWFDPANSGWGMTLTEQGDVRGAVLYTYDPSGEPTWVAGFDRGRTDNSVEMFSAIGACPYCAYFPSAVRSMGTLGFELRSETDLTIRNRLTTTMASGVNVEGARLAPLSRPASSRGADRQLAAFADEAALKAYLASGMLTIAPPVTGGNDFSASPPPPPAIAYSTTNLQETGVDEADVMKTDGRRIYTYEFDVNGVRLAKVRVARILDEFGTIFVDGAVSLTQPVSVENAGLYLHGDRLVAVFGTAPRASAVQPWTVSHNWLGGVTSIEIMDAASRLPQSRWRAQVEGHPIASRRIGDRLYVVSRFVPLVSGFIYGASGGSALEANRQRLAAAPLATLLPKASEDGFGIANWLPVGSIYVPPQGGRQPLADFIIVTAIDLVTPRIVEAIAIVGAAETVYASPANLVLATSRFELRTPAGLVLPEPSVFLTDLHQIALDAKGMRVVGSATLEGFLSNDSDKAPFRLSEREGQLRAVTSSSVMWSGNRNRLSILEPSTVAPGLLKTVATLPNARRPESLGKPNEFLYATRFVGDRLYAVTFPTPPPTTPVPGPPMVDPLYVVELADRSDPRIAGELVVPGFSEYLHPMPNGLMLGFGREASTTSEAVMGLQLSLYDVRDAGKPREVQKIILGRRGSDSALLQSHHALSTLLDTDGKGRIAIPVRIHEGVGSGTGDFTTYPWAYSGLARFELQGSNAADMRLVSLPPLVSHTASGRIFGMDPGASGGRSVLLRSGVIYMGQGRFWRQDAAGVAFGPM